jgi:hypothetical protein
LCEAPEDCDPEDIRTIQLASSRLIAMSAS